MATKAELAGQRDEYERAMGIARSAEAEGLYSAAVQWAMAAWPFVDGMMQFWRKYEQDEGEDALKSVGAIDLPLRYAPLLFRFGSLNKLGELLRAEKRIDRNATDDLAARLSVARERLWLNHRLFSYLELNPGVRQDSLRTALGGDQEYWRNTCEAWQAMGLLERTPEGGSYCLTLVTRLEQLVWAKCSLCATRAQAPKAMFLETMTCAKCGRPAEFVLTGDPAGKGG